MWGALAKRKKNNGGPPGEGQGKGTMDDSTTTASPSFASFFSSMNPFHRLTMRMTTTGNGGEGGDATTTRSQGADAARNASGTGRLRRNSYSTSRGPSTTARGGSGTTAREISSNTGRSHLMMQQGLQLSHRGDGQLSPKRGRAGGLGKDGKPLKKKEEEKALLKQALLEWEVDTESPDLILDGKTISKLQWPIFEEIVTKESTNNLHTTFTSLSMKHCLLTDADFLVLAPILRRSPFIKQVNFSGNSLTDEGLQFLIEIMSIGNLVIEELDVRENLLTSETGRLLYEGVKSHPSLRVINGLPFREWMTLAASTTSAAAEVNPGGSSNTPFSPRRQQGGGRSPSSSPAFFPTTSTNNSPPATAGKAAAAAAAAAVVGEGAAEPTTATAARRTSSTMDHHYHQLPGTTSWTLKAKGKRIGSIEVHFLLALLTDLQQQQQHTTLIAIDLSQNNINAKGLNHLLLQPMGGLINFPGLRKLNFNENLALGIEGGEIMATYLEKTKAKITEVSLCDCGLTAGGLSMRGVKALARAVEQRRCRHLLHVSLEGNEIKPELENRVADSLKVNHTLRYKDSSNELEKLVLARLPSVPTLDAEGKVVLTEKEKEENKMKMKRKKNNGVSNNNKWGIEVPVFDEVFLRKEKYTFRTYTIEPPSPDSLLHVDDDRGIFKQNRKIRRNKKGLPTSHIFRGIDEPPVIKRSRGAGLFGLKRGLMGGRGGVGFATTMLGGGKKK